MSLGEIVSLVIWWIGLTHMVVYTLLGSVIIVSVLLVLALRYVGYEKELVDCLVRLMKEKRDKRPLKEPK